MGGRGWGSEGINFLAIVSRLDNIAAGGSTLKNHGLRLRICNMWKQF